MQPDEPSPFPRRLLRAAVALFAGLCAAWAQAWMLTLGPLGFLGGLLGGFVVAWWALVAVVLSGLSCSDLPRVRGVSRTLVLAAWAQLAMVPIAAHLVRAAESDARAYCEALAAWESSQHAPPPRQETRDLSGVRLPDRALPTLLRRGYSPRYRFRAERTSEGFMAYFPAATGGRSFWQGWATRGRWSWDPLMD